MTRDVNRRDFLARAALSAGALALIFPTISAEGPTASDKPLSAVELERYLAYANAAYAAANRVYGDDTSFGAGIETAAALCDNVMVACAYPVGSLPPVRVYPKRSHVGFPLTTRVLREHPEWNSEQRLRRFAQVLDAWNESRRSAG